MTRLLLSDLVTIVLIVVHAIYVVRAVIRPHREPAAKLAWVLVILLLPVAGVIGYWFLGEMYLGKRRRRLYAELEAELPRPGHAATIPDDRYSPPFLLARQFNRLPPTTGNRAEVLSDHAEIVDRLIADIDAAKRTVHVGFYIWLADRTGTRLTEALLRAARRGVEVRVLVDGFGSRGFIASPLWRDLSKGGVRQKVALKVANVLPRLLYRRIDLRNHRKTVIVDSQVAWFGSMNAADAEFLPKADFAPWIDLMLRCEGPVARHAQYLFAIDWMGERGDDLTALLSEPEDVSAGGLLMQVAGTGPTIPYAAMSECFSTLAHTASREIIVTTPYFVPDEALLFALCSAARRGVAVTLVLPERNDSWLVAAASRSSYAGLLDAGVGLLHYPDGLLHAKTMTVDGEVALVGSANMDRRSLDLNFENNVLVRDRTTVAHLRAKQQDWMARSAFVSRSEVATWGVLKRLWHNLLAMLSPIL